MGVARKYAHERVVSVLEGGYDLEGLSRSVGRACDGADGGVIGAFLSSPRKRGSRRTVPSGHPFSVSYKSVHSGLKLSMSANFHRRSHFLMPLLARDGPR